MRLDLWVAVMVTMMVDSEMGRTGANIDTAVEMRLIGVPRVTVVLDSGAGVVEFGNGAMHFASVH